MTDFIVCLVHTLQELQAPRVAREVQVCPSLCVDHGLLLHAAATLYRLLIGTALLQRWERSLHDALTQQAVPW